MEAQDQIGRYKIIEEVGHGGMSVVYRATDQSLGREVAIKVLHPHLAKREDYQRRFQREARAVARLRHPNILEIYDYSGQESNQTYIVTQFIHGGTLRNLHEEHSPILPELVAMLGIRLASALAHAHSLGVIHRDIKPENVMISRDGAVVLTDFGLAQLRDTHSLTMTGTVMGSPAHMSPEHILGKDPDERADIFSLGTLLYCLCTGRFPFDGPNAQALFHKILDGDFDPPIMIHPCVGDQFSSIVCKAMARDPDDRYQNAAELIRDLEGFLAETGLQNSNDVLRHFLDSPEVMGPRLEDQVVSSLMEQADNARSGKRFARAMSYYNRLVAVRPDDPAVQAAIASIRRRGQRKRLLRSGAVAAVTLVMISILSYLAITHLDTSTPMEGAKEPLVISPASPQQTPSPPFPAGTGEPTITTPPASGDQVSADEAAGAPGGGGETEERTPPPPPTTAPPPDDRQVGELSSGPGDRSGTGPSATQERSSPFISVTERVERVRSDRATESRSPREVARRRAETTPGGRGAPTGPGEPVWLEVRSFPYSTIFVNGEEQGTTTINRGVNLPPGSHQIELRNPGCYPHQQTVEVDTLGNIEPGRIAVRLRWLPSQLLVTRPPGADVYLENQPLGKTGSDPFNVPMSGPQRRAQVRVQQDVDVLWSREVVLRPGQTVTVSPP